MLDKGRAVVLGGDRFWQRPVRLPPPPPLRFSPWLRLCSLVLLPRSFDCLFACPASHFSRVLPDCYTLRHGGNYKADSLRNWDFQGSVDNEECVLGF